jgi:hypothetical protein
MFEVEENGNNRLKPRPQTAAIPCRAQKTAPDDRQGIARKDPQEDVRRHRGIPRTTKNPSYGSSRKKAEKTRQEEKRKKTCGRIW